MCIAKPPMLNVYSMTYSPVGSIATEGLPGELPDVTVLIGVLPPWATPEEL
jgi:hypothetical protein